MSWQKIGALMLAGALGACAEGAPAGDSGFGAAFGTPFLLALKAPICVATVALAAPLVGVSGFAPTPQAQDIREGLDQGMAQNCGPPYTFTAQR